MRMSDEADGERRMMGSCVLLALRGWDRPADGDGTTMDCGLLPAFTPAGYCPGRERLRPSMDSAVLRT